MIRDPLDTVFLLDPVFKKIMDPDSVCPERLDPVNIRPDPKPWRCYRDALHQKIYK